MLPRRRRRNGPAAAGQQIVRLYTDDAGATRWTWIGGNHSDVLGDSGEGYTSPAHCEEIARRLARGVGAAFVDDTRRR